MSRSMEWVVAEARRGCTAGLPWNRSGFEAMLARGSHPNLAVCSEI